MKLIPELVGGRCEAIGCTIVLLAHAQKGSAEFLEAEGS